VYIDLLMNAQPDGITCGPTCLHAIYRFYKAKISLEEVIEKVSYLENGGTLAVLLGCHALEQGYQAKLHSLNLYVLDPSWINFSSHLLLEKLRHQALHSKNKKVITMTNAYIRFLELGGTISFTEINEDLLCAYFEKNIPLLSGVNATYLYQNMRDYTGEDNQVVYDEFLGEPTGHFLILRGYDKEQRKLFVADPYLPHPLSQMHYYAVPFSRWLHAHLLGAMTNDAELLAIHRSE